MKVLSILALVLFVSTHSYANEKPAQQPAASAEVKGADGKAANPATPAGEVQNAKKKKKKH